jgi:hypothetical protein
MSQNNPKVYVALVIACVALALSIHTAVRGPGGPSGPGSGACVDQEARDQTASLRRALAERDAVIGRLARAANAPGSAANTVEPPREPEPLPALEPPPAVPPEPGRRRYARFVIPNPAVSVTQKDDGTYDIHTTDPALTGATMEITAVTASGKEDKVFLRVPQ